MLHYVTDPTARDILLAGYLRRAASTQKIVEFPSNILSEITKYYDDDICSMQIEIHRDVLLSSKSSNATNKRHHSLALQVHPDLRHLGSPLSSFTADDSTFSVYLVKTDGNSSCTSIRIVATSIPRRIHSLTVYCRMFCVSTAKEHKVLSDFVSVGDSISWHESGIDIFRDTLRQSPDVSIPIDIEFDILSIKYCTFDFKDVQLPSNNLMLDFEIDAAVLEKYAPSKKTFYSKPSKDGLWCLLFTKSPGSYQSKSPNAPKSEKYTVSLQLLGLPSMIGSLAVSMWCSMGKQQGSGMFTFSYQHPICPLPSIDVNQIVNQIADQQSDQKQSESTDSIHIAINLSISAMYDVKRNLILPHQYKEHGVAIGFHSYSIPTTLPPVEPRCINGKYEWDLCGDDELADFLKWPNGNRFEPRYVCCVATGFLCSLYPNGMNFKNDGYVQFGVKNVCIPPDIQSFIVYFRMYCTETATEFQDIRLIKCANFTLKWPAKILSIDTVREEVIGNQQYNRLGE